MGSSPGTDLTRRRFLTATTSVVGAVGTAFAAYPFLAAWQPSAKARAAGAPVEANISQLERGQRIIVEWRGQPVWIVRRSEQNIADLAELDGILADPESLEQQQPEYAKNNYRSLNPEFLVLVGICTHLGCSPTYLPSLAPHDLGPDWKGGFFCPCHGSKFDLAGRVYDGVPAPTNMVVPPYRFVSDSRVLIGDDGGAA